MTREEIAELERPYLEALVQLQRDYTRAAKPYIDAMLHIRSLYPAPMLIMSVDDERWVFINKDGKAL